MGTGICVGALFPWTLLSQARCCLTDRGSVLRYACSYGQHWLEDMMSGEGARQQGLWMSWRWNERLIGSKSVCTQRIHIKIEKASEISSRVSTRWRRETELPSPNPHLRDLLSQKDGVYCKLFSCFQLFIVLLTGKLTVSFQLLLWWIVLWSLQNNRRLWAYPVARCWQFF